MPGSYQILEVNVDRDLMIVEYTEPPERTTINIGLPENSEEEDLEPHIISHWPVLLLQKRVATRAKGPIHAQNLHDWVGRRKNYNDAQLDELLVLYHPTANTI